MNKKDVNGLSVLIDKLYVATKKLISRAEFDRTSIGQIIKVNGDGTYNVAAFSGTYTLPYKEQLKVGDIVRVKIPQNVWKEMYIESVA